MRKTLHRVQFEPMVSSHRCAGTRITQLIAVMILLTGTIQLYAQSRTATASLTLQVRPEELLQVQAGGVALKIRLARGTTARLWAANACTSPSLPAQLIVMSGAYSIPFSALTPASRDARQGTMQVCLASSDGLLRDSAPLENFKSGTNSGGPGPVPSAAPSVSLAVPAGVVVTTRSGITTWSNP